jgi:hypothetical protein
MLVAFLANGHGRKKWGVEMGRKMMPLTVEAFYFANIPM